MSQISYTKFLTDPGKQVVMIECDADEHAVIARDKRGGVAVRMRVMPDHPPLEVFDGTFH